MCSHEAISPTIFILTNNIFFRDEDALDRLVMADDKLTIWWRWMIDNWRFSDKDSVANVVWTCCSRPSPISHSNDHENEISLFGFLNLTKLTSFFCFNVIDEEIKSVNHNYSIKMNLQHLLICRNKQTKYGWYTFIKISR